MCYKRLPIGIYNFAQLREEDFYYVDKTPYIRALEDTANFLFFSRPRRFGKSLFVSMVRDYYDINAADRFETEFKGTWIYDNPTKFHNQYQVLFFDFSLVKGKTIEEVTSNFNFYCSSVINDFIDTYKNFYAPTTLQRVNSTTDAGQQLSAISIEAKRKGYKIYIIVDEYDNFTNNILTSMGLKTYTDITHGTGFYRDFLKIFKAIASRYLLLGISPCTLDDLTSGLNNFVNITAKKKFNRMLGFSEDEVRQMIQYYQDAGAIKGNIDDIIADMRPWYDNYCFSPDCVGEPTIYNSDMVLYYLSNLIDDGKAPREMLDPNTRTDYAKLKGLVARDTEKGERRGDIRNIATMGYINNRLVSSFPAEKIIDPAIFPSLLYYYGMLTIGDVVGDEFKLIIPNENVRQQYYGYLLEIYQQEYSMEVSELVQCINAAACQGHWEPLMDYLTTHYKRDSAVRSAIQGERHLQGYFLAYLNLTNKFITHTELEAGGGYCDFFLFGDNQQFDIVKHSYIIELKYLKNDDTATTAVKQWDDAVAQLRSYAADEKIKRHTQGTTLHLLALQMRGQALEKMQEIAPE